MVPKGWKSQFPVELVTFFSGFAFKSEDATSEGARWLKIANVGVGEIKWDSESYLPKNYLTEYKKFLLEVGDIVVAMTRPTLGKYLKIAKLNKCEDKSLLNQRVAKLVVADAVDSNFIYHLFRTEKIAYLINTALLGTDPPNLSVSVLRDFKVLVPPLLEQKKIAQILSTWDKVISVTEKLLINSQQQKKALMQQLLTGKKRLLDENGVRFSEDWSKGILGDLCTFRGGSAFGEKYQGNVCGDLPFIKVSDMNLVGNERFIISANNWVDNEVAHEIKAIIFPVNSIVFAKVGAALLLNRRRILIRPTIIDNNMMAAICTKLSSADYVYQLLLSIDFARFVQDGAVPSVNQRDLASYKVRYPEIKEQQKIAAVLSAADAEISTLEKKLACLKDEKKALMQQLLTGKRRVKVEAEEAVSA